VRIHKGFRLRFVLGLLVIGSVLITAVIGGYFAWKANKASLTSGYLDSNYHYAKKLSSNTSELLQIMRSNIGEIAAMAGKQSLSQKELNIWYQSNKHYFNSILIADQNRKVTASSVMNSGVTEGLVLTSEASFHAIEQKRSLISEPYIGPISNRLLVMISSPIIDEHGEYAGFAAGTIYLDESNAIHKLLNEHFYGNGSYVYVADKHGHLIYHPDKKRLNETITNNKVINEAITGLGGSQEIINSKGKSYFAGYDFEPITGWAIVAQTPTSIVDKPLKELVWSMLLQSLPLFLVILLVAWYVSYVISKPLFQLAAYSEEAILSTKAVRTKMPKAKSYIYEVRQLNQSLNNHINLLNKEIRLDGLTGLANRKTFDLTLQEWLEEDIPFALILLDIDYFKKINDEQGHLIGDEVLIHMASQILAYSRSEDLCFRYGGEEFGILVKHGNVQIAEQMAERLREAIAVTVSPAGSPIFVSIGISLSTPGFVDAKDIIEMADKALYQSKARGRNRTTVYEKEQDG
jgi:diguanylate cyclase (GGDEF)-like protein